MLDRITVGNYVEESGNQRAIYEQCVFRMVNGSRSAFSSKKTGTGIFVPLLHNSTKKILMISKILSFR